MATVSVEPTDEYPVPYDDTDDAVPTLLEQLAVAGNTAELQVALGASLEMNPKTLSEARELLEGVVKQGNIGKKPTKTKSGATKPPTAKPPAALTSLPVAYGAASFLRNYGQQLALDVASTRAAITTKLMEIADCGDPKYELKALELLGKHSDIGLFTERSEVTINYKTPEALEDAIKERVKRLLNAEVVDVTPVGMDLDEELGIASPEDAEFEEVMGEEVEEGEEEEGEE